MHFVDVVTEMRSRQCKDFIIIIVIIINMKDWTL